MVTKRKPYKVYTNRPASEVAMELGIRRNQLYKWKEQMNNKGDVATAKRGRPKKESQSTISTLRQEMKRVKDENTILKKAAVFFAQELK